MVYLPLVLFLAQAQAYTVRNTLGSCQLWNHKIQRESLKHWHYTIPLTDLIRYFTTQIKLQTHGPFSKFNICA